MYVCVHAYTYIHTHTHTHTYMHTYIHTYINKQLSWTSEYVLHYGTVMSAESLPDVTELIY